MFKNTRSVVRSSDCAGKAGMRMKRSYMLSLLVGLVALPRVAAASLGFSNQARQSAEGTWELQYTASLGFLLDIKFPFSDGSMDHNQLQMELPQLSIAPVSGKVVSVNTSLVRDGGEFVLVGEYLSGKGAGRARFLPNASYLSYMRSLGFSAITPRDSLDLALFDVDRAFAGNAKVQFPTLVQGDLISWKIMGVTPSYAGFVRNSVPGVLPKEVIGLHLSGVTLDDINRLTIVNRAPLDASSLRRLKTQGVDASYIEGLASVGYASFSLADLSRLRSANVNADSIRAAGLSGKSLSADALIAAKTRI